ncbi:MAG: zinc ribbon domain-containing protein [Treponema sp.]|jgi:putative FmdB family regulatory protein|nr:zinc ribbon domain-containing protein [Treponema sp.]
MPTYEYECKSCGHVFEFFQAMSDEPLKNCPECGKSVRRLIHGGTGVIFKGSGFYVTDKSKAAGASSKTPKSADAAPAGGSAPEKAPAASSPGGGASGGESVPKKDSEGKAKPAAQTS